MNKRRDVGKYEARSLRDVQKRYGILLNFRSRYLLKHSCVSEVGRYPSVLDAPATKRSTKKKKYKKKEETAACTSRFRAVKKVWRAIDFNLALCRKLKEF